MDAFWKWLLKANARGILVCALIALAGVIAWWAWKEFFDVPAEPSYPPLSSVEKSKAELGPLAYVDDQFLRGVNLPAENPFLSPLRRRPAPAAAPAVAAVTAPVKTDPAAKPPAEAPPEKTTEPPKTAPVKPVAETAPAPVKPAAQPAPAQEAPKPEPPEKISLTYRGIFKRTDGKTMALIEDSKTESSQYYAPGADVFGTTIGDIGFQALTLTGADKADVSLKIGEPVVFQGGVHADPE